MALGQHIMLRLIDDRVIAVGAAQRRRLARSVLRIGREHGLLGLGAADTHLHLETLGDERNARRCAWRVELSLSRSLGLGARFRLHRIKPILSQGHLGNTLHYVIGQDRHHGVAADPFLDATNLPDLVGMRVVGAYTRRNVHNHLPRVSMADLLPLFGVELGDGAIALEDLADAAAGAYGLDCLEGRKADAVAARRAAVHAASEVARAAEIAEALGITRRRVDQLLIEPGAAADVVAVSMQWRLRAALTSKHGNKSVENSELPWVASMVSETTRGSVRLADLGSLT
jgi:hypothetical protein